MKTVPVKLTEAQVKAVEAAFPDSPDTPFSKKLRDLVASGLALYQIYWPETPQHGGGRKGAGRKKNRKRHSRNTHDVR
jgi:hypothetical protein